MPVKSLIVGVSGQDGWFLNQHLTAIDHDVWGLSRDQLQTPIGETKSATDIIDADAVNQLIERIKPDQIYYLAAKHHSADDGTINNSDLQQQSQQIHVQAPDNFLAAIKTHHPQCKFFYAASSHLFAGKTDNGLISETTEFAPIGIYAKTKLAGVELCRKYRQQHGIFALSGFLFNHESWRRSDKFLSRKIVQTAVKILREETNELILHDLSAQVDWSFAGDTVRAMRLMLEMPVAEDLIIASGKLHSVEEFAAITFDTLGLDWRDYVTEQPQLGQKPKQKIPLVGDSRRLKHLTGWQAKVDLAQMIKLMIEMELQTLSSP
ncbi:MAG: GDP-mannose 4,6-dehydratase [Robiginitomaculum sp.]|nr:GDP-mannose 4,6-dehydratase [Robiginitomaculum sp.]